MEQWTVHILLLKYTEQPRKARPKERPEEETQSRSENASEQMHTTDSRCQCGAKDFRPRECQGHTPVVNLGGRPGTARSSLFL